MYHVTDCDNPPCPLDPTPTPVPYYDYQHKGHTPMATTTYHTYADLLLDGGRLAATQWDGGTLADAVVATLRLDPDAVVLRACRGTDTAIGLAPGGLA